MLLTDLASGFERRKSKNVNANLNLKNEFEKQRKRMKRGGKRESYCVS